MTDNSKSSFKLEEISQLVLNKKETKKVLKITKKTKDTKLHKEELIKIYELLRTKIGNDNFYIRVLGNHGYFTPKTTGNALNLQDIDHYIAGRVASSAKFTDEFFHAEVGFIVTK